MGRIVLIALLLQVAVVVRGAVAESSGAPTGITSRLHSLSSITLTSREHADHPELALVSAMAPWQALEPSDDTFDLSRLDANVRDARDHGYRLILRVMAGRSAPSWLWDAGVTSIPLLGTDANAVDFCDRIRTSIPWDPILEAEYTELMDQLGRWMSRSDGAGGTNGDHVYLVPVSMPSVLGTEMVYGYGPNIRCPEGTDGVGTDLATSNRAAWDRISTEAQRRSWVAEAWVRAIAIHMRELPQEVNSVIALGSVFGDGHAASMGIASDEVARYGGRLWSMYTNLRPEVAPDGSLAPYRLACSRCDAVIRQAVASGGSIGFQVAGGPVNDPAERFRYSVLDALSNYPTRFLETSPGRVDRHEEFLLTGSDPIQAQLARLADPASSTDEGSPAQDTLEAAKRPSEVRVRCEQGVVGRPSRCTATVVDSGGAGAITPGGLDAVVWSSGGQGSLSVERCSPTGADGTGTCSVEYIPGFGSVGVHRITAAYDGDASHAASSGSFDLEVERRRSATSITCDPTQGGSVACVASVDDADVGQVATPSGTVSFALDGGAGLGSCTLEAGSSGRSRCVIEIVPPGQGTLGIVAGYEGDVDHAASAVDRPASVAVARAPDTQAPLVAITRPADGSSIKSRKLMIAAKASDDVGVTRVVFDANGQILCEDTSVSWSCAWRVPVDPGVTYVITATAFDAAGNSSSDTVTVSRG